MKNINMKPLFLLSLLAVCVVGCKDDAESISRVTNYPDFTMNGDAFIIHQLGDAFTDPGVTATEAGKDIEVTSSASGTYQGGSSLDVNTADEYHITYSATNKDGFAGSVGRTVIVANNGDMTTSIEGLYTSTVVRNGSSSAQYTDMAYVMIWKNTDGTYELSDGIGGYYNMGRGYGTNYVAPGMIVTANDIATNDFTITDFGVKTFGGACTTAGFTVDAAAKTINFITTWDVGYDFDVTLTQVAF
jgi:hypothetical protein